MALRACGRFGVAGQVGGRLVAFGVFELARQVGRAGGDEDRHEPDREDDPLRAATGGEGEEGASHWVPHPIRAGSAQSSPRASGRHGCLAGEALADVGGGLPSIAGRSLSSAGEPVPSGPPARTRWGRCSARTDGGQLGQVVADQGHLLGRGEVEVERPQQVGEGLGVAGGGLGEEAEDALGLRARSCARRSARRGAAGRSGGGGCRRGSGGRRSPCGGRSATRGRRRWRRSRRARRRRSGRSSSRRASRARSNQRCSKVAS